LNYPSAPGRKVIATNLYGPDIRKCNNVRVVGNYFTQEKSGTTIGCMYEGSIDGSGKWKTLAPTTNTINTIAHSTMKNLVVGNYDSELIQGKTFIYDVKKNLYYDIIKPGAKSITAYGIWYNGGHCYTICGGFSNLNPTSGLDSGYIVDWNNKTLTFSNWKEYSYQNNNFETIISHFNGITSDGCDGYNFVGDAIVRSGRENKEIGFFAHVGRNKNTTFSQTKWEEIKIPDSNSTSGNSVADDIVIGVYTTSTGIEEPVNGYISVII